ncbi:hypothetical protein [Pedococcus cremeus]|nr:hypothetical protein [Pedococcus cremeus]
MGEKAVVRGWLAVGAGAVVAQEWLTTYPEAGPGPHLLWGFVSLLLLYRIYRRSELARRVFVVVAVIGAVLAMSGIPDEPSRLAPLALAYVVQALAVTRGPVRGWTRRKMVPVATAVGA